MLRLIPGIGGTTAAVMAREVLARTFKSRSHLGSYLGMTPSAFDSGSTSRCQGISKAGNSWARRIFIEIAWIWQSRHPDSPLTQWYKARTKVQSPRIRRIMLVAMARKLAIALWRYVEAGVVPDGVELDTRALEFRALAGA
ncbi:transposase [Novosphingobium sp. SG751A]|uniref:transposase n=1 Tax=Novosphingobium sp. SG751A TaxID=2587000 RepID=UPI0035305173